MAPSLRMSLSSASWLLLPLVCWMLARVLLVHPAQRQVTLAQQALLEAEHLELTAELAAAREERLRLRLEHELHDLADTADRMDAAERAAEAQLDGAKPQSNFVLPGHSRQTGEL